MTPEEFTKLEEQVLRFKFTLDDASDIVSEKIGQPVKVVPRDDGEVGLMIVGLDVDVPELSCEVMQENYAY